jgi:lysyl-tRNA synthetase class 2
VTDWQPGTGIPVLRARAELFATLRSFFAGRGVLEVDTPLLASHGVTDPAIEPLQVTGAAEPRFLQTSPEFFMKRLLAAGSGPIYQLGKVFRAREFGARHNPEFTMLEWYRPDYVLRELIDEVTALVIACVGAGGGTTPAVAVRAYGELFDEVFGIDPHRATVDELANMARGITDTGDLALDRDGWLDLLMTHGVEPALQGRGLVFVCDYPESQAALARCVDRDGILVADRFEAYLDGIELANGYRELRDPGELEARAARDNRLRAARGQPYRALDPRLLAAQEAGLPDCSGVALGVDRLLMYLLGAERLDAVLPFAWERC